MKERTITKTTLNEVDQLERQYALKNKRASVSIKSRVSDNEKIIFCYYEINRIPDVNIFMLTDMKFLYTNAIKGFPLEIREFPLNKLDIVKVSNLFELPFKKTKCLMIDAWTILEDVNEGLLQNIVEAILKAKANFEYRLLNPQEGINNTKPSNQNAVASQLEKLADLYQSGVLTKDEYTKAKERVLNKN